MSAGEQSATSKIKTCQERNKRHSEQTKLSERKAAGASSQIKRFNRFLTHLWNSYPP